MGWVVNATPRPLDPRERPGTRCTGGWVGVGAGLDGCGKSRPHRDSIPGPTSKEDKIQMWARIYALVNTLLNNGCRVFFSGVKRPERGVHHPPRLAPRLNKEYSYTSTPPLGLHGLFKGDLKRMLHVLLLGVSTCPSSDIPHRTQRNWVCFCPQVKRWGKGA